MAVTKRKPCESVFPQSKRRHCFMTVCGVWSGIRNVGPSTTTSPAHQKRSVSTSKGTTRPWYPRSRSHVEPCEFCVRRGDLFSIGSERWTKVSLERRQCYSHHAHNVRQDLWGSPIADTFCPHPPPLGIPPLAHGLGYSPLRRKIPHVRLAPLNVGSNTLHSGPVC